MDLAHAVGVGLDLVHALPQAVALARDPGPAA